MDMDYFQALENKIEQLINRLLAQKEENKDLISANRRLEEKVQELQSENGRLQDEIDNLKEETARAKEEGSKGEEIKNRLEGLLGKIDEVVES